MTEDHFTRPERAAQIRQAKRYRVAIRKRGLCSACVHRDKDRLTVFGMSVCKVGQDRLHFHCEKDGRQPTFEFDPTVLKEFADDEFRQKGAQ